VGDTYSRAFTASSGTPPYSWAFGGLPAGITETSDGVLGGTFSSLSSAAVTITVTDSAGKWGYGYINFYVSAATANNPVISGAPFPAVSSQVGNTFSRAFSASSGTAPYSWSFTGLPSGITETSDGVLGGTFSAAGNWTISVTVTDNAGKTATTSQAFIIAAATVNNPVITGAPFNQASGKVGDSFSTVLSASSGTAPYTWNFTGLPPGITETSDGVMGGTYSTAGSWTATVKVTDSAGETATATIIFSITDGTASGSTQFQDSEITVYKNTKYVVGPDASTTVMPTLFPSISKTYSWFTLPTITQPAHGVAVLREEWVASPGYLAYYFSYTPTADYVGDDSIIVSGVASTDIPFQLTLTFHVVTAGSLTITPVGDITLFEGDEYGGKLFTVSGGTAPFRTAKIEVTTPSYPFIANDYATVSLDGFKGSDTATGREYVSIQDSVFMGQFPSTTDVPFDITAMFKPWNDVEPFIFRSKGFYVATLTLVDGSAAPGQTATASVKFIVYGLDGSAPDPTTDPGDPNEPPPAFTAIIQGTLRLDTSDGVFAARDVYLYDYTTGAKIAETVSDGTTGVWEFTQVAPGEYFVVGVAQGDDLAVPRDFDAMGVITVA
jgi:hypothetical protein